MRSTEISNSHMAVFSSVPLWQARNLYSQVFTELDRCFDSLFGGDSEQVSRQRDGVSSGVALEAMEDAA